MKSEHITCLLIVVLCCREDEDGWDYDKTVEMEDGDYNKQTNL